MSFVAPNLANLMLVMLGGALGAGARYGLMLALLPLMPKAGLPWVIVVINVLGSFLLGFTLTLVGREVWSDTARLAFGTGVLGAFTTFSTFSVDIDTLLKQDRVIEAMMYIVVSIGLGVLAAVIGRFVGERF